MGKAEVEAFLIHLAVEGNVSASTQNHVPNRGGRDVISPLNA